MNTPSEKQGYLGDLEQKSTQELQALLQRQESLFKNQRHLLSKLPDKGAKVQTLTEHLKEILAKRESQVDQTTELFEKMALAADQATRNRQQDGIKDKENDPEEGNQLQDIINVNSSEGKIIIDERIEKPATYNVYERIMKKETDQQVKNTSMKSQFVPSRTARAKTVKDLPASTKQDLNTTESVAAGRDAKLNSQTVKSSPHKTLQQQPPRLCDSQTTKLRYRYDESLESTMFGPGLKHQQAQVIDLQDAISLQQEQKRAVERLQIEQAASKLAQRFQGGMSSFNPEGDGVSRSRVPVQEFDDNEEEREEEEEEVDYPD